MNRREIDRIFGGMLAASATVVTVLLSGCNPGDIGNSHVYFEPIRYRLTAEVQTPQGVKTGSSVIQTIWDRGLSGATVTGEAVAVDLPGGQTLFVLLRTKSNADWAGEVPGVRPPQDAVPPTTIAAREAEAGRQVAWLRADRAVHYLWGGDAPKERAQYLPYMVRFGNIADPKSVEQVDAGDLAKTFGPRYRLRSLTVQMTDDPVTMGIIRRLLWLSDPHLRFVDPYHDPKTGYAAPRPAARQIHEVTGLDFKRPFRDIQ